MIVLLVLPVGGLRQYRPQLLDTTQKNYVTHLAHNSSDAKDCRAALTLRKSELRAGIVDKLPARNGLPEHLVTCVSETRS